MTTLEDLKKMQVTVGYEWDRISVKVFCNKEDKVTEEDIIDVLEIGLKLPLKQYRSDKVNGCQQFTLDTRFNEMTAHFYAHQNYECLNRETIAKAIAKVAALDYRRVES